MRDDEQWRPIAGWEGYEVPDQARVRSIERVVVMRDGRRRYMTARILKRTAARSSAYTKTVTGNATPFNG